MRDTPSPTNSALISPPEANPTTNHPANNGNVANDISAVVLGTQLVQPWYASSYPRRLVGNACTFNGRLYVCEFCFKYTPDIARAMGHKKFCSLAGLETLGTRVHTDGEYAIYEVDGEQHPLFCQNLTLFAKLFLDTKSICYDVDSFLFYTLTETIPETQAQRVVGFFSKEKMSWDDYNLACILVFPPYQRRGLGKLLISFSYELSKKQCKIGSPEKPLSDLGYKGYMSYWSMSLAKTVSQAQGHRLSVTDLSKETYIHPDDVCAALDAMGVLKFDKNGRPHIRLNKCIADGGGIGSSYKAGPPKAVPI